MQVAHRAEQGDEAEQGEDEPGDRALPGLPVRRPGRRPRALAALRRARRDGAFRPRGAIGAVIIGTLSTIFAVMTLAAFTLFSAQLSAYSRCLDRAQTPSAQQACLTQLQHSIDARIQTGS